MDTVSGENRQGLFRFCNGLSVGRLVGMCLGYHLGTLIVVDGFVAVISLPAAVLWTLIDPRAGFNDIYGIFFLLGHSIAFFLFAIAVFNSDFDESLCRRCGRPWGYAKSSDMREEDTDANGILLLGGRKRIITTTLLTCRFCDDYREETDAYVCDRRNDTGG
jgi:hypothetical protein